MQGLKVYQNEGLGKQGLGPDTGLCRETTDRGNELTAISRRNSSESVSICKEGTIYLM